MKVSEQASIFIEELAKKMHVNINYTTKHSLNNNITQNAKHQGVALDCSEVNTPTINLMDLENLSTIQRRQGHLLYCILMNLMTQGILVAYYEQLHFLVSI